MGYQTTIYDDKFSFINEEAKMKYLELDNNDDEIIFENSFLQLKVTEGLEVKNIAEPRTMYDILELVEEASQFIAGQAVLVGEEFFDARLLIIKGRNDFTLTKGRIVYD